MSPAARAACSGAALPLLLLLASACQPDDRWLPTRARCDLAADDVVVYPNPSIEEFDAPFVYTEDCARAIGDDLGADWEAFGDLDLPGDFRGPTLVRAIAGAWLLLGMDVGTVTDLLQDPAIPPTLHRELGELAAHLGLADDEPGSRLLYNFAAGAIRTTVPREGHYEVSVSLQAGTLYLPTEEYTDRPYEWVDTIMHEASHAATGIRHDNCTGAYSATEEGSRDATWDATWGFSAFVAYRLRQPLEGEYNDEMARVLSKVDWVFCDDADVPGEVYEEDRWE